MNPTSKTRGRSARPLVESLEDRLALSSYVANGTLYIQGTAANDNVLVRSTRTTFDVTQNRVTTTFSASAVFNRRVVFAGGAGNDSFANHANSLAVIARGDAGNDALAGAGRNDWLDGGAGDDRLYGSAGGDVLYGGAGNDKLYGGAGYDSLHGQAGDDFLDDGSGAEVARGGGGVDFNAHLWAIAGATAGDIFQGSRPNCGQMAALAGVARTTNLASRISYLGNGVYRVGIYNHWGAWGYRNVVFNGDLLSGEPNPNPGQVDPRGFRESWVILMIRADDAQNAVDQAVAPHAPDTLPRLTGRPTSRFERPPGVADIGTIRNALLSNRVVCAATGGVPPSSGTQLVTGHWYTVTAVTFNPALLRYEVTLRNPWGVDGPAAFGNPNDGIVVLPWNEFNLWFTRFVVN